jgi:DNA-binding Xre family transcriptional regulator
MEHQNFKPYGLWQREERQKRGLTLQELAHKSQLNNGTLSRIEKQQSNVMFSTGIRICQALGVTPGELAYGVFTNEHYAPNSDGIYPCEAWKHTHLHRGIRRDAAVGMGHLEHLIGAFYFNSNQIRDFFEHLIHEVVTAHERAIARSKDDPYLAEILQHYNLDKRNYELSDAYVDVLLSESPYNCFSIAYPNALKPEILMTVFQQGGVLLDEDMVFFLKQSASDFDLLVYQKTDPDLAVTAQRLEEGDVSSVYMEDVLRLDYKSNARGKLIERYWYSTMMQYYASPRFVIPWEQRWSTYWHKQQTSIAKNYVFLTRWLYVYGYVDFSSLHESLWKLDVMQQSVQDYDIEDLGEHEYFVYDSTQGMVDSKSINTVTTVKNPLYYPHFNFSRE